MIDFGPAAILGLCLGFMWGTGCSLAILYSIYMGGYRKATEESQMTPQPARFHKALTRLQQKNAQKAAAAAAARK
jgi:hypothetical protein